MHPPKTTTTTSSMSSPFCWFRYAIEEEEEFRSKVQLLTVSEASWQGDYMDARHDARSDAT